MNQSFDILDTASLRPKGGAMVTLTPRDNWFYILQYVCVKYCYLIMFYFLENRPFVCNLKV